MSFTHVRACSSYSLLTGMLTVEKLVALTKQRGMQAVGLCDRGNMFGAMRFAEDCKLASIKPLFGCSLKVAEGGRLTLLAKNEEGWRRLIKLVSRSFLDHPEDPRISLSDLEGGGGRLIVGCGGADGILGAQLRENRSPRAEEYAHRLRELFPGAFYVEMARHGRPGEAEINRQLVELADSESLPLLAAQSCYYADKEHAASHKTLLAIKNADDEDEEGIYDFKSEEEMTELFADLPDALTNAAIVAERASFLLERSEKQRIPRLKTEKEEQEVLKQGAEAGLKARLESNRMARPLKDYEDRLKYELEIISKVGFAGYFLIVADIVGWARKEGIPVGPGRGSGAGSLVSWALEITDLDPLQYGLLFERFLNPERGSMPDFDVDFCEFRRDRVIDYVKKTYGEDKVAQIVTFSQLKARAALRDVGRVQGLPFGRMSQICSLVPFDPINPYTIERALEEVPELREVAADEEGKRLIKVAQDLEGLHRHVSTHAAGMVIADEPLENLVPLYADSKTAMATQFDMAGVEAAGLVKFDFLGLKTLTVIDQAMELAGIKEIPPEDEETYKILGEADTVGVFQLESEGMREVLRRLKPDRLEDIIAVISLYRPGPMDNIPSYIDRKQGGGRITNLDQSFDSILEETYGIPIYQEQVMQIAQAFSGFSLTKADILRKAMGKKDTKVMEELKHSFIEGALGRGKERKVAEKVFALVEKFAGYGFNKSHAAAYALVAYRTAWLKRHRPGAFYCASMSQELGNTEKLALLRRDASAHGIRALPPDINESQAKFALKEADTLTYALAAIRHVGLSLSEKIAAERAENGDFASFIDFVSRLKEVNKRALESLIWAGCFDGLGETRSTCLRFAAARDGRRELGPGLFDDDGNTMSKIEELPLKEMLNKEFALLGFYRSLHPLADLKGFDSSAGLAGAANDSRLHLLGYVVKVEKRSIDGKPAAFIILSDPFGEYEVAAFGGVYEAIARQLVDGNEVKVSGRIQRTRTRRRFNVSKLSALKRIDGEGNHAPTPSPTMPSGEISQATTAVTRESKGKTETQKGFLFRVAPPGDDEQKAELVALGGALAEHLAESGSGSELRLTWGEGIWRLAGRYKLDESDIEDLKREHRPVLAVELLKL